MDRNIKEELLEMFHRGVHLLHRSGPHLRRQGHEAPMPPAQARLMRLLAATGPVTQRDLSERLDIRSASLSELLGKLEKPGWIRRRPNATDKRTIDIELTEEGDNMLQSTGNERAEMAEEIFGRLTEDEMRQLHGLLGKLIGDWETRFEQNRPHSRSGRGHCGEERPGHGGFGRFRRACGHSHHHDHHGHGVHHGPGCRHSHEGHPERGEHHGHEAHHHGPGGHHSREGHPEHGEHHGHEAHHHGPGGHHDHEAHHGPGCRHSHEGQPERGEHHGHEAHHHWPGGHHNHEAHHGPGCRHGHDGHHRHDGHPGHSGHHGHEDNHNHNGHHDRAGHYSKPDRSEADD